MKIEIESRWSAGILFSIETENLKLAVEAAVKGGADLRGADLRGAYLRGAYLGGADLRGAYLGGAYLRDANIVGADLRGADLRGAYLGGADLEGADLRGANIGGANGLGKFPIQIGGHKHWLITTPQGHLRIGCHSHTFDYWLEHCEKIGRAEGYSDLDVEIYRLHIEHIAKVASLLWNAEKKEVASSAEVA